MLFLLQGELFVLIFLILIEEKSLTVQETNEIEHDLQVPGHFEKLCHREYIDVLA